MRYLLIGLVWLALAILAGGLGLLARLRPPLPQLMLLGITTLLLLAGRAGTGLAAWIRSLGWRPLVALHLTRFVGFGFLASSARGVLPRAWAYPAGIGDIAVAALALLLLARPRWVDRRPVLLLGWNVVGLVDILFVVASAARLALTDPEAMAPLVRLPYSLLITWLVPLIIATHLWLFRVSSRPITR
ncbi:MAG: hypothetical protein AB7R55_13625 [Gemmatimonadales bacterium]